MPTVSVSVPPFSLDTTVGPQPNIMYGPEGWAHWEQSPKLDLAAWGRDDLGPTAWNRHLHPSLRFSGTSNHLSHAFLQSPHWGIGVLKNYCIWVRNTASHVCFCFGCQCRPLQRINRITIMAVAPSGEYQSSLYLSLTTVLTKLVWPNHCDSPSWNSSTVVTMESVSTQMEFARLTWPLLDFSGHEIILINRIQNQK